MHIRRPTYILPLRLAAVACLSLLVTSPRSVFAAAPAAPKLGKREFAGPFGESEWKASAEPLRPGSPNQVPFWNVFAERFIFAPAFDIKPVTGATQYRFDLKNLKDGSVHRFQAATPHAPLSAVWAAVPAGNVELKITALAPDGRELGLAGEKKFFRAAPFDGPYLKPEMPYDASGALALEKALGKPFVQSWFKTKEPDYDYYFYRYPAKLFGSLIVGAVTQARLKAGTEEAKRMTELARIVADYNLSISFPAGKPLEYFPPAYGGKTVGKNPKSHMQLSNYMIIAAAESGQAYLDLYDLTNDGKYFEAAKRIAQTYLKTQQPNGTWICYLNHETGQPTADKPAIPTSTINFFERLKNDYKVEGLQSAIDRAFAWIMANPVKDFEWLAQYEDVGLSNAPKYRRMSREQPCDLAIYLCKTRARDPKMVVLAEELIRFSEDQFITWEEMEDLVVNGNNTIRSPTDEKLKTPGWYSRTWLLPVVHEQYGFWMPSARNTGLMIETYWHAYRATKKEVYLAKALSIANNFTRLQKLHHGEYPTMFTPHAMNYWLNNSIYPARVMVNLQKDLAAIGRAPTL